MPWEIKWTLVPTCDDSGTPEPTTEIRAVIVEPSDPLFPVERQCLYGLTRLEAIRLRVGARCDGAYWRATLLSATAEYSTKVRPLDTQQEYIESSPSKGDPLPKRLKITEETFCEQVKDLTKQNPCDGETKWISREGTLAHERVHSDSFLDALRLVIQSAKPRYEERIDQLHVPLKGTTRQKAIEQFQSSPEVAKLQKELWLEVMREVFRHRPIIRDERGKEITLEA